MYDLRLFVNLLCELLLCPLARQALSLHRPRKRGAHLRVLRCGGRLVQTVQLRACARLVAVGASVVAALGRYQALATAARVGGEGQSGGAGRQGTRLTRRDRTDRTAFVYHGLKARRMVRRGGRHECVVRKEGHTDTCMSLSVRCVMFDDGSTTVGFYIHLFYALSPHDSATAATLCLPNRRTVLEGYTRTATIVLVVYSKMPCTP